MRPIVILGCAGFATLVAPLAQAQTPAPPDAAKSALRALGLDQPNPLGTLFGQRMPFVVTEGDHVVVHKPLDINQPLPLFVADDVTLRGRSLGDGRWWFDRATLPSSLAFGDASTAVAMRIALRTDGLSYHATFDPTHATENVEFASLPSAHAHIAITDTTPPKPPAEGATTGTASAPAAPVEFDVDTGVVTTADRMTAAVAGFVQDVTDGTVDRLVVTMPMIAPSARMSVGFVSDHGTSDVSPEAARAVTAAYNAFIVALKQSPDKPADAPSANPQAATPPSADLPPATLSRMKAMLEALRSALHSVDSRTEADDIDIDLGAGTAPYHLDRLVLAGRGAAPQGRLDVATELEFDGLSLPGLPAEYARLIPRRVLIRPHLGGVDLDDVLTALETMLDQLPGGEAAGEALGRALFHKLAGHGTLSVGLDTVAADFDGASLVGSGAFRFAGDDPSGVSATADLRITGIDTAMTELGSHAETKDAVASLVVLKGLGRQDGTVMTWHMEFSGGKLTVNGQDLSAIVSPPH